MFTMRHAHIVPNDIVWVGRQRGPTLGMFRKVNDLGREFLHGLERSVSYDGVTNMDF